MMKPTLTDFTSKVDMWVRNTFGIVFKPDRGQGVLISDGDKIHALMWFYPDDGELTYFHDTAYDTNPEQQRRLAVHQIFETLFNEVGLSYVYFRTPESQIRAKEHIERMMHMTLELKDRRWFGSRTPEEYFANPALEDKP